MTLNKLFYIVVGFLIFSCDFKSNNDCNGVNKGDAFVDDCGYCVGGNTGKIANSDKDCLGICFGDAMLDDCSVCDNIISNDNLTCDVECISDDFDNYDCNGIVNDIQYCWNYDSPYCNCDLNVPDVCGDCAGLGYVNCMCDYIVENESFFCDNSNQTNVYEIGDQLTCDHMDISLNICNLEDCMNEIKLSDLFGKVVMIEFEATW